MDLLLDFILIAGIVVIFIILFLLSKRKQKELPHRILILFFGLLLFVVFQFYGELHDIRIIYLLSFIFGDPIGYLVGPLLYIYIKSIFLPNENLVKKHLPHFIPFFIYLFIISLPILISIAIGDYLFSYLKILKNPKLPLIETLIQGSYLFVYVLFALRLLKKYQATFNLLDKDLNWIKYLLTGILMVMAIDISTSIYELIVGELDWQTGLATIIPAIGLIIYLGYYGVSQSRILLPDFLIEESNKSEKEKKNTAKENTRNNNQTQEMESLKASFLEIIETKKPYLDEDLTLNGLAQLIPTTDKKLSTLLNQHMNISFYDFINNYRVEEVKAKMVNPDYENYTLLAMAYDSGFKSKTTFNRIFKKSSGYSPSEYRKKFLT